MNGPVEHADCTKQGAPKDQTVVPGELVAGLRQRMGLTVAEFARVAGLSARTIATWEAGAELKEASQRRLVEIARLHARLSQAFPSGKVLAHWLKTRTPGFGGSQPLQVIERGEIDRIWRMIYFMESGTPG